jgi:hypothetical protein
LSLNRKDELETQLKPAAVALFLRILLDLTAGSILLKNSSVFWSCVVSLVQSVEGKMREEIEEWMVSTTVQGQGIEEKNRSMKSNTFFLEIRRRQKRWRTEKWQQMIPSRE